MIPSWLAGGDGIMLSLVILAALLSGLLTHHALSRWCRGQFADWLGVAGALVAAAPLLGLLGTVSGLIDGFDALALSGDPAAAGSGIGRALGTTQVGLMIAVPGLLAVHLLQGWRGPRQSKEQAP